MPFLSILGATLGYFNWLKSKSVLSNIDFLSLLAITYQIFSQIYFLPSIWWASWLEMTHLVNPILVVFLLKASKSCGTEKKKI